MIKVIEFVVELVGRRSDHLGDLAMRELQLAGERDSSSPEERSSVRLAGKLRQLLPIDTEAKKLLAEDLFAMSSTHVCCMNALKMWKSRALYACSTRVVETRSGTT